MLRYQVKLNINDEKLLREISGDEVLASSPVQNTELSVISTSDERLFERWTKLLHSRNIKFKIVGN